ncbi:MAG: Tol-Pal system beta propeller repeat protein TolB [Desulfuromonadaceae bacterium]|nr:Tol-Pal system beta propeller repeat protein TolB [Desulfuromonadaceae bacterium]MDD5105131.1 Tol-Pal system beta propeller repeat protein TolB [Desulfuromonadaceae bacterium]
MLPGESSAQSGYIEVTAPGSRMLKLAVDAPLLRTASLSADSVKLIPDVLTFDMNMSGTVTAETRPAYVTAKSTSLMESDFAPWLNAGFDLLVRSEITQTGDQVAVEFRLFDVVNRKVTTSKRYLGTASDLRRFSHLFADEILRVITGEKGAFTTRIAYVSTQTGNKEIYIMDWDGYNPLPLTKNHSINMNPDFTPDGRQIIFTSYKRGNPDLYRRSLSNTAEVVVSKRRGLNITGSWAPDGSKIALALSKDGDAEIYTLNKDGAAPVRLTVNSALDLYPSWSPDGTQIAFVSDRLGKPQVFLMKSDGSNVRRLTTTGSYNVNPRWSPKGDKIAYSRMSSNGFNIFSVSPDGSADRQLTTDGNNENPAWSPDGRFICFSSKRSSGAGVYVMRSDGTGQTKVTHAKGTFFQPTWSAH